MNWNELHAFLAVAETESFSRAAERLHLTQPAISKRIQQLEAQLGTRLFDRVGKRVYLTDAGRVLQPRARALLSDIADTRQLLQNLNGQVSGVLSLATSHHVGLHRLAPALRTFSQRFPDVQLDIRFEDSEEAHGLVRSAQSELAVVTLNPNGDPELRYLPLWDDPLAFAVSNEHEFAQRESLTLAELAAAPSILPGLSTYTGRILADAFRRAGHTLRPHLVTNYLETIAMLVGIGLGWGLLPRAMIRPPLRSVQTDLPVLQRTLGCVTNPARTLSNAGLAFQQVLQGFADGT